MGDVERALDVAAIRILSLAVEYLAVMLVVVEVDCSVECQKDDLRRLVFEKRKKKKNRDTLEIVCYMFVIILFYLHYGARLWVGLM